MGETPLFDIHSANIRNRLCNCQNEAIVDGFSLICCIFASKKQTSFEHMKKRMLLLSVLAIAFYSFSTASSDLEKLHEWTPAAIVSDAAVDAYGIDSCFQAYPITDEIFDRMYAKSYKENCTQPRSSLRYLRVLHRNAEGKTQLGEIVCNQAIAADLLSIFRKLYDAAYPIERITLIDDYNADDETSMRANNTSCFNFRAISGSTKLSKHSQGLAIDINPLYNPCIHLKSGKVEPSTGKPYANNRENLRNTKLPIIDTRDLCYRLFVQQGFKWGGAWRTIKDYQHFEK